MQNRASKLPFNIKAALALASTFVFAFQPPLWAQQTPKPNIIVIMADDLGFSDLGCYGGEIKTPNLDKLGAEGVKYTQFYNSGRCCPSRAALLTGKHPHEAGMAEMVHLKPDKPLPDGPYQGYLSQDVPTIAELLKSAGYATSMTGKWHIGEFEPNRPRQRGFDWYFGLISGANSYYEILPNRIMLSNDTLYVPPANFFMTDAITDSSISFIQKSQAPFFQYIAYTAPHWPLHAPEKYVAKYRKLYAKGWDKLKAERWAKQQKIGLATPNMRLSSRHDRPAFESDVAMEWSKLTAEQRRLEIEKMAVYAAMVEQMDEGVGKIIQALKALGQYDNTYILFLSDNGGCHEIINKRAEYELGGRAQYELAMQLPAGPKGSYVAYGPPWANLSNTPFRHYKAMMQEGGIASPLIVKGLKSDKNNGKYVRPMAFITDIAPTCLELAGVAYPPTWNNKPLAKLIGATFEQRLTASQDKVEYAWEHFKRKAYRKGNWKIVAHINQPWELYDMDTDRSETNDLAAQMPDKVKELEAAWLNWAQQVGVKLP